jgi:F-type H+-transporting ATPase subunit delta
MKSAAPDVAGTVFDDPNPELARNYAESLINAAGGDADATLDELDEMVDDLFVGRPEFASLMGSPVRSAADKDAVLVRSLEGRASPLLVRFLRVLNRHGRLALVGPVSREARRIWDRRQGRVPVTVLSATELDESQLAAVRDKLVAMTGGTPVLSVRVDPSLIGGLVVQVGDIVYDASVRRRLEQLRQRLIEGKTHEIQERRDRFGLDG